MPDDIVRSGFVAVLGRPNVGKSTLVNALVGEKVSIVTRKPQTTRHTVLGVVNCPDSQLILVDTPGLTPRNPSMMHKVMNRSATGSAEGADISLMVAAFDKWSRVEDYVLECLANAGHPIFLAVNKSDLARPRDRLLPFLDECSRRYAFEEIVPVSATKRVNLDKLTEVLVSRLPEGPPLFPEDQVTDRGLAFTIGETVREKLMEALHQELPYGIAVEVQNVDREPGLLRCEAVIWVPRASHKRIVIGRRGSQLKRIGTRSRIDLESQLGGKVHLETHVKVRRNWLDDPAMLRSLGFET